MKARKFILSTDNPHWADVRARVLDCISELTEKTLEKPVEITISEHDPNRTLAQNAYYWTAMVTPLAEWSGHTKEEMHEVLLGEFFGTVAVGDLIIPKQRSSTLKKKPMREYLDWIPRFAAENGVVIGVPE